MEMTKMGTLRCPMCDTRLSGKDEASLSSAFKSHMVQAHKVKLPESPSGKGDTAWGAPTSIKGPKVEGAWGEEVHGKKHLEERKKKGQVEQQVISLRCPMCGALMVGADEDEISDIVKTHLSEH